MFQIQPSLESELIEARKFVESSIDPRVGPLVIDALSVAVLITRLDPDIIAPNEDVIHPGKPMAETAVPDLANGTATVTFRDDTRTEVVPLSELAATRIFLRAADMIQDWEDSHPNS